MVVFWGEGKPEYTEKTSRCRVENQQTQPTYDAEPGNRTRTTWVGSECSHHCAIPAPQEHHEQVTSPIHRNCQSTFQIGNAIWCRLMIPQSFLNEGMFFRPTKPATWLLAAQQLFILFTLFAFFSVEVFLLCFPLQFCAVLTVVRECSL